MESTANKTGPSITDFSGDSIHLIPPDSSSKKKTATFIHLYGNEGQIGCFEPGKSFQVAKIYLFNEP